MIKNENKKLWMLISLIPYVGGVVATVAVSFTLSDYGGDEEERPFNVIPLLIFLFFAALTGAVTLIALPVWLKWILAYVFLGAGGFLNILYLFFELSPERIEKRKAKEALKNKDKSAEKGNSSEEE